MNLPSFLNENILDVEIVIRKNVHEWYSRVGNHMQVKRLNGDLTAY